MEDLLNEVVIHKTFGKGKIQVVKEGYIQVQFEKGKTSKFLVPSCFDKFLTMADKKKQEAICEEVENWKLENGIYEKEALQQRTQDAMERIKARELAREQRRKEKADKEALKSRFFAGLNAQVREGSK